MVSQKPKYCKSFERNSHWRKLSIIMVWERYCYASPTPEFFFIFFVYIFIHISASMSPFGLKYSQMILLTETSKLMYNWSFFFVVLHKPTLLPSTWNRWTQVVHEFQKLKCDLLQCSSPCLTLRTVLPRRTSGTTHVVVSAIRTLLVLSHLTIHDNLQSQTR